MLAVGGPMATWNELLPGFWRTVYTTKSGIDANGYALTLADGDLAVISPIAGADEATFAGTDALGKVVALVAPNSGHDLGQAAWQARYPAAVSYGPAIAAPAITKAKRLRPLEPLANLTPLLPGDVKVLDAPGTSSGSMIFTVERAGQRALFIDEVISNNEVFKGPLPFKIVFSLTGSTGPLATNKVWLFAFCKDKPAYSRALIEHAGEATMLLFAHGEPATGDMGAAVRERLGGYK
jgi:glyoxylase-like metal-dependent hydrolase (beta-lactamase superfamily II)